MSEALNGPSVAQAEVVCDRTQATRPTASSNGRSRNTQDVERGATANRVPIRLDTCG